MTYNEKTEKSIVEKQAKLLGEWVKKMQEKDKRIKELEEDVVFLKKVIALCMNQSKNTVQALVRHQWRSYQRMRT
jgi:hypothetical protein